MNNDLISREYLRDAFDNLCSHNCKTCRNFRKEGCSFYRCALIDNAPTAEYPFYQEAYQTGYEEGKNERPKDDLADEVWKLYEKHHSHLATHVLEFGYELKELLCKYQEGGAE